MNQTVPVYTLADIRKTINKKLNINLSDISLSKEKDGILFWEISVATFPHCILHFKNIRWPLTDNTFARVEDFALDQLLKANFLNKRFSMVTDPLDWKYYAKNSHSHRYGKLVKIFNNWFNNLPKTKNNNYLAKLRSISRKTRGNGFPDIVFNNRRMKKMVTWEIKAPNDFLRKDQIQIMKKLKKELGFDVNVLEVKFTPPLKKEISSIRKVYKTRKEGLVLNFKKSITGKKLETLIQQTFKYEVPFNSLYSVLELLVRAIFTYKLTSWNNAKSFKLILNYQDLKNISEWAYNMGYPRWWIFNFILIPFMKNKIGKNTIKLLSASEAFDKKFNSSDLNIDLNSILKHLVNKNSKSLEIGYNRLIEKLYQKLRSY